VFPLTVPPLRRRGGDVDLLAHHFLAELNSAEGSSKRFTRELWNALRRRQWPATVRELKNVVERAFIRTDAEIVAFHTSRRRSPERWSPRRRGRDERDDRALAPAPSRSAPGTTDEEAERRLIIADARGLRVATRRRPRAFADQPEDVVQSLKEYRYSGASRSRPAPIA
jgi:transcriptional regulator with GAF, ATPase, and Fis domain